MDRLPWLLQGSSRMSQRVYVQGIVRSAIRLWAYWRRTVLQLGLLLQNWRENTHEELSKDWLRSCSSSSEQQQQQQKQQQQQRRRRVRWWLCGRHHRHRDRLPCRVLSVLHSAGCLRVQALEQWRNQHAAWTSLPGNSANSLSPTANSGATPSYPIRTLLSHHNAHTTRAHAA